MLGTGKVKLVDKDMDPYEIMASIYKIGNSNAFVARMRANQLFNRAGANRQVITPGNSEEFANREDILDNIAELSRPYVIQICSIISKLTSPFKRKCAVGFFMANGTSIRFPEEFKLDVDTDDPVRNVENEEINNLITGFKEKLYSELNKAVIDFDTFIDNNFPKVVKEELLAKPGDYWIETTTGNYYKAISKLYNSIGETWDSEEKERFKAVLQPYREAVKHVKEPKLDMVCDFLCIDKQTLLKTARDAIGPIIAAAPDKLLKNLINGR